MSYIQDNLLSGEEIVYRARFHWFNYAIATFFILAGLLLLPHEGFTFLAGIFLIAFGSIDLIRRIIMRVSEELVITNRRVIYKNGVMNISMRETSAGSISTIRVHQHIIGRLFSYGTIFFSGTGYMNSHKVKYVADPVKFKNIVNSQKISFY